MHKGCAETMMFEAMINSNENSIVRYLLGAKREGDGDRVGARSLTWMRITVALLVRRLSTAHLSADWLSFFLSIATATNPLTPSFLSDRCFGNHITFFHCNLILLLQSAKYQTKGTLKAKISFLLFL